MRKLSSIMFRAIHGNNLIYNACWEDPRLDREALRIGDGDSILMITSAGCNALDYALAGPRHISAVDVNPRQNALLELKLAGIHTLDFETFFELFGRGRLAEFPDLYRGVIRERLSLPSRAFWDKRLALFAPGGPRGSFYYHGACGLLAWLINRYLYGACRLREPVERLLNASSLAEQNDIYMRDIKPRFWNKGMRWILDRDVTMAMLGVPRAQREEVERYVSGGITGFIEQSLDAVFTRLPLRDNYFWRVYLTGEYTPSCCPEYLKEDNFMVLKNGMADVIATHTGTLTDYLNNSGKHFSRFVLLDHMDWLRNDAPALRAEWQAIITHAEPGARIIWRSGGCDSGFIDGLEIPFGGSHVRAGDLLTYDRRMSELLHPLDRVHTYGSFHIAALPA